MIRSLFFFYPEIQKRKENYVTSIGSAHAHRLTEIYNNTENVEKVVSRKTNVRK